ncbi:MAG: Crp/Fnr family transcriptional regulator [Cyanobacteria bacterium J06600_6]
MIDTLQENLWDYIEYQTFQPNELISLEANFYWLLQQGKVKCSTWTQEGNPVTLGYWGFNDLIGMSLPLVHPYHVKCLTEVKAGRIPLEETGKITRLIQRQVQQTEEILYILRSENTYNRLRQILIWLAQKFGREVALGKSIDLRLTHQDLADLVGSTRVTVTKFINQLEQENFLTRPRRNTFVLLNTGNPYSDKIG